MDETGIDCHVGPIIHTDETIFENGLEVFSRQHSVEVNLDSHHEDWVWINHIDPGLHHYVKLCLAAVGLDER